MRSDYSPNVSFEYPDWVLPIVLDAANRTGIPAEILLALLRQESGFNPKAVSSAGAQGIAQFMPATAREYGVDPWNPTSAIGGAADYLSKYYKLYNDWEKTLAAYNAGPGNVNRWQQIPETSNYVRSIMGSANLNRRTNPPSAPTPPPTPMGTTYNYFPRVQVARASEPTTASGQYQVRAGDTLWKIAERLFGSGNQYTRFSGYRSGNPNLIYPNEVIRW